MKTMVKIFLFRVLTMTMSILCPLASGPEDTANITVIPELYEGLEYRSIGPYRGGRVTAGTGVPGKPYTFYMGSTGGGVWKTEDAGTSWVNISDKFFKVGSIGAVAVSDSDPNVIYVGTGSNAPRGNISPGNGIYKSTDAGKTWNHAGLPDTGQIGRIRIHPENPNLVYAAVLGNLFCNLKNAGYSGAKTVEIPGKGFFSWIKIRDLLNFPWTVPIPEFFTRLCGVSVVLPGHSRGLAIRGDFTNPPTVETPGKR